MAIGWERSFRSHPAPNTAMTTIPATNPYPWPYDGDLDPGRLALVVCGAQRAIGAAVPDAGSALATIDRVARHVRGLGSAVVWVRHGGQATARPTFLPTVRTPSWELCVTPAPGDLVVDAAGWDACFSSTLDHDLRRLGRTHLLLAGLASEITVDSTVRTLNDQGYECLVLTDACAPVDPDLGAHAHASLTMSGGIFGALGTSDALLSALTRTETP